MACECDEETETTKVKVCGRHFLKGMLGRESKKLLKHALPSSTIDLSRVSILCGRQCQPYNAAQTENNVVVVDDDIEMFDYSSAGPSNSAATMPALPEIGSSVVKVTKLKKQLEEKRKEIHHLKIKMKRWEEKDQSAGEQQGAGQYYTTAHFEVLCTVFEATND